VGMVWSLPVVEHPAGRPSCPEVAEAGAPPGAVATPADGAAPGVAPGGLAAAGVAGLVLTAAWIRTMTRAIATSPSSTADPIHAGDGPPVVSRSRRARRRFEGMGVLLLFGREVQDGRGDGRRGAERTDAQHLRRAAGHRAVGAVQLVAEQPSRWAVAHQHATHTAHAVSAALIQTTSPTTAPKVPMTT